MAEFHETRREQALLEGILPDVASALEAIELWSCGVEQRLAVRPLVAMSQAAEDRTGACQSRVMSGTDAGQVEFPDTFVSARSVRA